MHTLEFYGVLDVVRAINGRVCPPLLSPLSQCYSTNTLLKNNKAADAPEDLLRLPPVLAKYRNSHSASECPPERQQAFIRALRRNGGEMKGRSVSIFPSLLQHGLNQMILQLCGRILTGTQQHQDLHVAITFLFSE